MSTIFPTIEDKKILTKTIEKTLQDLGKPSLSLVKSSLKKNYNCQLSDCCDHPEYLSRILKDLYGNSYFSIISSIKNNLDVTTLSNSPSKFFVELCK